MAELTLRTLHTAFLPPFLNNTAYFRVMLGRYPQLAYLIQCFAGPLPHRTLSDRLFSASLRTMTAISLAFGDLPEISYRYILGDLPEKYDRYMPGLPYSGASLRTTAAYCCYLGPPIQLTYLKRTATTYTLGSLLSAPYLRLT